MANVLVFGPCHSMVLIFPGKFSTDAVGAPNNKKALALWLRAFVSRLTEFQSATDTPVKRSHPTECIKSTLGTARTTQAH